MVVVLHFIFTIQMTIGPISMAAESGVLNDTASNLLAATVFLPTEIACDRSRVAGEVVGSICELYRDLLLKPKRIIYAKNADVPGLSEIPVVGTREQ